MVATLKTPGKTDVYLSKVISGSIENNNKKDIIKTFIREKILYNEELIITLLILFR